MNGPKPPQVVLLVLTFLLAAAWTLVMLIAIAVSEMMLDSLAMIVELAGISP